MVRLLVSHTISQSLMFPLLLIATAHIRYIDTVREQLELRLKSAEAEVHRLRNVNEALMLGAASQRQQGAY